MSDTYGSGIYGTAVYGAVIASVWSGVPVGGSSLLPQLDVQIDLTPPTDAGHIWTTVVNKVRSCTFTRSGRSDEFQRTSPGTLTLSLDNRGDAITSLGLKKAQWVRVLALWAGVQYELWRGIITSAPRQWPQAGTDALVTVQAADVLYLMRLFPIGGLGFPIQRADERIRDICNVISSPAVSPLVGTLDSQTDTLDAVATSYPGGTPTGLLTFTNDALSAALAVEASDNGLLIGDPVGTVSYQGRQWRAINSSVSQFTLGEQASDVKYRDDVTYEDDDSRLANVVSVSNIDGSIIQKVTDLPSQVLYWVRNNQSVDRTLLSSDGSLALAAAQYLLYRYRDPPPRLPAINIDLLNVTAAKMPLILGLTNSQRLTWRRSTPTPILTDVFVEQIQHSINPAASWTVGLQLSPASIDFRWLLGDAVYGQLGTATVLSY